jgi:hypothetical protein
LSVSSGTIKAHPEKMGDGVDFLRFLEKAGFDAFKVGSAFRN